MKSRVVTIFTIILFTLMGFGGGYAVGQLSLAPPLFGAPTNMPEDATEAFAPFWEVWHLVHARYYEQPVDDNLLTEGAIDGMLAALGDRNTRYLSPEDEAAARQSMEGEIEGIGATVESVDGNITIVSPIEGSPAEEAGLEPGDILRQANGVDLTGLDILEAVQYVRGPEGTTVNLTVDRDGSLFEVEIMRAAVQIESIRGELLEENIAYVRIRQFGNNTATELQETLADLMAENPAGLIVDVRHNPGGSLDTAVDVADQFLTEGTILYERFGSGRQRLYESNDGQQAEEIPLVVLIDEGSASASEVLAGAIRDRERGVLIGQTSFGKGTVQTWQALSNGGGVRITIARWLTPQENWVHEEGLQPDYFIPLPDVENEENLEDTQLQAAIDYLLGEPVISVPPAEG